jgi:tetratricopeptide (TPR) repeat protein
VRRLLRFGRGAGTAVLVVSGDAGSGRTSLLDQAAERARALGCRVLQVRLAPIGAGRPYGAAIDLLRPLAADGPLTGQPVLTHRLDALDRLFGGPTRRPPTPLPSRAAEQQRVFTDARRLLRRACARRPLLLVVDDLQWADPSSVELLRHVVVQPAGLPLRLIVSFEGSAEADPFRSLASIEGRPAPSVTRTVLRRKRRASRVDTAGDRALGELDPAATTVLQHLGAAGGSLELSLLREVLPAGIAGPGAATLTSRGLALITPPAHQPELHARRWAAADAAYRELTGAERRELHLALYRAAARQSPLETAVSAYHAVRSADLLSHRERLAVLSQHALAAGDCFAEASTVVAVDAALLAADSVHDGWATAVTVELLDLRAEVLAASGRPHEAIESWTAAAELALLGRSTASARRFRKLAETAWATGQTDEAWAHLNRAAAALPATPQLEHLAVEVLRARIRSQLAIGGVDDVVGPLAELWRRTGWRGAEAEYKLALHSLRPGAGAARATSLPGQRASEATASATISKADTDATAS